MSLSEQSKPEDDTLVWSASNPAPENRDLTGKTLGDFQIERMLGRGGMGEVYLARQISLNRQVALKLLRADLLTKENYLRRFEAEATAVARLNHPNIVHVYTLGDVDGYRFIAMEYVQGTNLRDYIVKKGALDLPLALSIMKQAGVAVGAAGEVGLIHRDIKPENLLLTRKGQVKIADFGLCRDQDANHLHLTQPGVTMGTPLYMSPEQAQGHATDHRSDLYSLGVTFYHMLAGAPPFRADSPIAVALKHVKDTPVSLTVHRPEIPPELDRLVLRLMAKRPEDRYQSAAEMLRDLAKVKETLHAPSGPIVAADVAPLPAPAPASTNGSPGVATTLRATAATDIARPRTSSRLSNGAIAAIASVGLAIGAVCGWLARPQDLLAAGAPEPSMPALWLAPDWKSVKMVGNAEAQYRYAQLRATPDEQAAAWLAVPGNYPRAREWVSGAYVQLARLLLREREADSLRVLAGEIERWGDARTHEKELVILCEAGAKALGGDLDGVIEDVRTKLKPQMMSDPALVELGVEVVTLGVQAASRPGAPPRALELLRGLRREWAEALFQYHAGRVAPARARANAKANADAN